MNLIIDIGNSRTKVAVYEQDALLALKICERDKLLETMASLQESYAITAGILSSVVRFEPAFLAAIQDLFPVHVLTSHTAVPFANEYLSKDTLGLDRIALVSAAVAAYPNQNCLIIDAGTCITFDFVTKEAVYLGGAISPGLAMRYKALHEFTSQLPLLEVQETFHYLGKDTRASMHSGVLNGVVNELDGVVNQYRADYEDLTVVLTGGDANFLAKQLKNGIFATRNFLLEGLNTILNYNIS